MARDPDLLSPTRAGVGYCPTKTSTNGQYLPKFASKCLVQADEGGQYAVYENWRIDSNPADTSYRNSPSDQTNWCGDKSCIGPMS